MKIPSGLCQREKATMRGWNRAGPPTRAIAGCRILARLRNSEGGALVEMALVLPVFMLVMTGIFSIGTAYSNQLTLTQAVGSGAQYLQQIRTSTTDPCSDTFTAIKNAAPGFSTANLNVTVTMNGVTPTQTGNSCAGAQTNLAEGTTVSVAATYPCNISVYGFKFSSSCLLNAQVSEYEY
jgi:Flp pilus assembly protein TadG